MGRKPLIFVGLAVLALGAVTLRPLRPVNRFWQDRLATLPATDKPSGQVVVVAISDADISRYGTWPWDRALTAKLFRTVASGHPKVVAFDGYFPHRSIAQSGDSVLARTFHEMAAQGVKLVLPFQFSQVRNDPALDQGASEVPASLRASTYQMLVDQPGLESAPFLRGEEILSGDTLYQQSAVPSGHIHSAADPEDGTYRRNLLVVRHGEEYIPSVVVALLAAYRDANLAEVSLSPREVHVKDLAIPMDRYGFAPLRWLGGPGSLPTIAAAELLENPASAAQLQGKIVLVGVTSAAALNRETGDFFRTPVADRFPGVEIWGVALENALQKHVPVAPAWLRLLELVFAVAGAGLCWRQASRKGWGAAVQVTGLASLAVALVVLLVLDRLLCAQSAADLPLLGLLWGWGGALVFRPSRSALAVPTVAPASVADALQDNARRIGKFEIVRELGRGAMGVVYDGFDRELDRHAAIKVIAAEKRLGERPEESLERFRREARAIAALNHPSIVTIYESGEWQGNHYIAMEFLRGRSLDVLLSVHRPDWPEVRDLGGQILAGLAYAHAQGVVHRDVKPANIMVDARTAKLTDFGLARKGDASMTLTQEGTVLGTPYYMAPEQVEGKRTDARSDQFSLGLVLFEMLAGERAYDGEDMRGIMLAILLQPPKDLAPRLPPDAPTQVLDIIDRMLHKDPAERFPDLDAVTRAWHALPV